MKKFIVDELKIGDYICIEVADDVDVFLYEINAGSKKYYKIYYSCNYAFSVEDIDTGEKIMFLKKWFNNTDMWNTLVAGIFPMSIRLYFCDVENLPEKSFWNKIKDWFK